MNLRKLLLTGAAALILPHIGTAQQARTLDLVFMPPAFEPRNVCNPRTQDVSIDVDEEGEEEFLEDVHRILYIDRHVRQLINEDPVQFFEFISDLISWRERIDARFAGPEADFARIDLYIAAGKFDELAATGVFQRLRAEADALSNNQKMKLARHFRDGIAVAEDLPYARELVRQAAYAGHANALLDIARMQLKGEPMPDWDAPLDLTVTMAFGGFLGQLDEGVCRRAERLAQEYLEGNVVSRNPDVARAWLRFSADLGSRSGAWRMVEFHLKADAAEKDNVEMLHYLKKAVERGMVPDEAQIAELEASGARLEIVREILGFNHSEDRSRRAQMSKLLELRVNVDAQEADEDGLFFQYLQEVVMLPSAPGRAYTRLARETRVRFGRWGGEDRAREYLEKATELGDAEGQYELAALLVRYRDDPAILNRAVDLWTDSVSRHGMEAAMHELDSLYRCKAPDAPRLWEAQPWADAYAASEHKTVPISATDLIALDRYKEPWTIARIQSQALNGRIDSLARHAQRVQIDPFMSERAQRIWAKRLNRSDKAMELFAELEFELATNPAERTRAIEFFRRVYLNNGVTTALDLAIALVEDNGRVPEIADEILRLLDQAAHRGEGAAIRLISRLQSDVRTERSVYEQYADEIEKRGDFLAMMFSLPHVSPDKRADYFDRAVQQMNCSTKDVEEMADAYTILGDMTQAFRWKQIGLTLEGKHVLSKLRLSDVQLGAFDTGAAPNAAGVQQRALEDGDLAARRVLYQLTSDPNLENYDPDVAAGHLLALAADGTAQDQAWVLGQFRRAGGPVQDAVLAQYDISALFRRLGEGSDVSTRAEFGLLLRDRASSRAHLAEAAQWLKSAAEAGNIEGMAAYGDMLGRGLGVVRDVPEALAWLDQAARAGHPEAERTARLLRLSGS
ncbi:tetratricopeptide repeat protein [Pseudaestuariivita sp.]|uniref:tetratricopeptide repeat protein n=1 Tax=Pseudaestuariivita sp. TaxID=2211669 RepID=UPI0040587EAD